MFINEENYITYSTLTFISKKTFSKFSDIPQTKDFFNAVQFLNKSRIKKKKDIHL